MNEDTPLQASLRAIATIQQTPRDYIQGIDNPDARRQINEAIRTIEQHFGRFGPSHEKIVSIREMGDALFRARKHLSYGGVDKVRSNILADCMVLSSIIERQAQAQSSDD